jgi:copper chaperone NosL
VAAPAAWALLSRAPVEVGPPSIRYGRDRCDACGMIISDPRYAAAARVGGTVSRYDDIGCLVGRLGGALATGSATAYVHDAGTQEWLEAEHAAFVRSPTIQTPMASGIAAYATREAAARAHMGAEPMTFETLLRTAGRTPS